MFVTNSYISESNERDKCLVDEVLYILPFNDSADSIELLLRVLSTLPVEVKKYITRFDSLNKLIECHYFIIYIFSMKRNII